MLNALVRILSDVAPGASKVGSAVYLEAGVTSHTCAQPGFEVLV